MSILKRKILANKLAKLRAETAKASVRSSLQNSPASPSPSKKESKGRVRNSQAKQRQRIQGGAITPKCYLKTKNIVTNFGKAIATFALSDLTLPYLIPLLHQQKKNGQDISAVDFLNFVKQAKGTIGSIDSLRSLLLVKEGDSLRESACKKVFQGVAEVFIKYFSVNWITHGRVTYKLEHLKFRHKMLRRIQNPELFSYLKGSNERKNKKIKEILNL